MAISTGYVCKQCKEPSPVGVGYATNQPATQDVSACPCGHSRKPDDDQDEQEVRAGMDLLNQLYAARRS